MIINKRCITAFSKTHPFIAIATKSKLFDPSFSLTSELVLINYITGKFYPPVTTDLKFCKILWCETQTTSYLAAGHENGIISIYERTEEGLVLVKTKTFMDEDITALDFLPSKAVLAAGSSKGKIIFWTITNLDKDYKLDIPLSVHITAIAWNPKVTKILCIGTLDGSIKVLDIKKNSVIMTLNSKDFTEVKKIEWDNENNTKLLVMSEKGYLNAFDLSNDSVSRVGSHSEPLIGFHENILVSKNLIENGRNLIKIKDSFDCSISSKDSIIALSYFDGTTEILPLPTFKKKIPFFRKNNLIISYKANNLSGDLLVFKINIKSQQTGIEKDKSYAELIQVMKTPENKKEIADFLLKNFDQVDPKYLNQEMMHNLVSVDLNDKLSVDFIKGDFTGLKDSEKNIKFSYLCPILESDVNGLENIKDFQVMFILSKILNNYSCLSKLENPRILASILLYNNINDYSILSGCKEALILRGLLNRNINEYINNRIFIGENYMKNMSQIEDVIMESLDFETTHSAVIDSKFAVEYFWFKVFNDKFEDVKDLKIKDKNVEFYILKNTEVAQKLSNMNIKQSSERISSYNTAQFGMTSSAGLNEAYGLGSASLNRFTPATNIPNQNIVSNTVRQPVSIPLQNVVRQPVNIPQQNVVRQTNISANIPSSSIPQPPKPVARQAVASQPFGTRPQTSSMSQQFSNINAPTPSSVRGTMSNIPQFSGVTQPNPPSAVSSIPQPSPPSATRVMPNSAIPQPKSPAMAMAPKPVSNAFAGQTYPPKSASYGDNSLNTVEIVRNFNSLVESLKAKAATKNSLIIKQRKNQCLNALSCYDTIDKSTIPFSLLEIMDMLNKRLEIIDERLKLDVDLIVDRQGDCVWLKAVSELVKMLY